MMFVLRIQISKYIDKVTRDDDKTSKRNHNCDCHWNSIFSFSFIRDTINIPLIAAASNIPLITTAGISSQLALANYRYIIYIIARWDGREA